jgi:hypothetical protein
MLWLGLLIGSAAANEIIVPDFHATPGSSQAGPEIVYAAMMEALGDRDLAFLDADDLREFVGEAAADCPARAECPGNVWADIEGELALLGTVTLAGDDVTAVVEYHKRGVEGAVEIFQAEFKADVAARFAVDAALIAEDVLRMDVDSLPTAAASLALAPATVAADALGVINPLEGDVPAEPPATRPTDAPAAQKPAVVADVRSGRVSERSMTPVKERRYMGITKMLYEEYQASGMSRAEFLGAKRIRAKSFYVELSPGVVFGDVQRRYAVRTALVEDGPDTFRAIGSYERDQFLPSTAFSMVVGAGFAPTWWLDLGLNVGMEFPRKELITGFEAYASKADFDSGYVCTDCADQTVFQPATALTFLVEPRVRLVFAPAGLVKPYAVGGWSTRFNDRYETPDLDKVAFQDRPGVQTYGPMGGLGIGIDPKQRANSFIEGTYTHLLGPGIMDVGRQYVQSIPEPVEGSGVVMTVRIGVASRF